MTWLRQNDDTTVIIVGPFLDETDFVTPEAGLDVTTDVDLTIFKSDGSDYTFTPTATGGPNDMVHVSNGCYSLELSGYVDVAGYFVVQINATGSVPVRHDYLIVDANAYDTFVMGGYVDVNLVSIDDNSGTPAMLNSLISDYNSDDFEVELNPSELNNIGGAVWEHPRSPMLAVTGVVSSTSLGAILDVLESDYPDDFFNGHIVIATDNVTDSTKRQARFVVDYVASTQSLTIAEPWNTNPDSDYALTFWSFADANLISVNGSTTTADVIEELFVTDAATVKNSFADALLKRDWTAISGEAERSALKALRFLRNRWTVSIAGLLSIYKEDGATISHTMDLTHDVSAENVTGADPN